MIPINIDIKKHDVSDVVIVGAGAAGLFSALTLATECEQVLVISNKTLGGVCASCWAQGGIAAAVGEKDSTQSHMADTLKAAAGTAKLSVVKMVADQAPKYIQILDKYGVKFDVDRDTGAYKLSREACHAHRRVLRAISGDGFGKELMRALVEAVRNTPQIRVVENMSVKRLLRADTMTSGDVRGVCARDINSGQMHIFAANAVLLATGGIGGLYAQTTNPLGAVGCGVAMAARAGAVLSDLEFVQFHPTALDIGEDPAPLATEALRGEGAFLVNDKGERFMEEYHEMADLAPRDIVSRAIFSEIQQGQKIYLDCRDIDVSHFDALVTACRRNGLDPACDLIPVRPAAHYHMGGIVTDENGRSSLSGLWACGEVASTGLHGANRLASNSLMEAVVMGGQAAQDIMGYVRYNKQHHVAILTRALSDQAFRVPKSDWMVEGQKTIRKIMLDQIGVVRTQKEMIDALDKLCDIEHMAEDLDSATEDMALVAKLIAVSSLIREESRGGHYRSDFPKAEEEWKKRSFITLKQANAYIYTLYGKKTATEESKEVKKERVSA